MPGYIGTQKKGLLIINKKEIYFKPDMVHQPVILEFGK